MAKKISVPVPAAAPSRVRIPSTRVAALKKQAVPPAKPAATPATTRPAVTAKARGSSATAKATVTATKAKPSVTAAGGPRPERSPTTPTLARFTRKVLRPSDLLSLDFTFINLRIDSAAPATLRKVAAAQPAYVVVTFPAQHLLEQAFFETAEDFPIQNPPADKPTQQPDPDKTTGNTDQPTAPPVQSRLSGSSRLVFRVPAGNVAVPYQLDALLAALSTYELSVAPTALPPAPPARPPLTGKVGKLTASSSISRSAQPSKRAATTLAASQALAASVAAESQNQWIAKRSPLQRADLAVADLQAAESLLDQLKPLLPPKLAAPTETQTAIEAPTRLILSPSVANSWIHAGSPVASAATGRVELWHTRLAVRLASGTLTERDDYRRAVRAIWALGGPSQFKPDDPLNPPDHANTPFRASLDAFDRHNLVHLSANQAIKGTSYKPVPVDVETLALSSLGAYLNLTGSWTPPNGLSVENWRHRATLGRDHYVRVVYAGVLYPFGHRASLIKVTERKFHGDRPGNPAYLRQRMFIVVREPFRLLGNTGLADAAGRSFDLQMPFKSARIGTLVTPNLDDPDLTDLLNKKQGFFWPHVGTKPFLFQLQLEDASGGLVDLTAPLLFIGNENLKLDGTFKPNIGETAVADYNAGNATARARRRRPLAGQRAQLAPTQKLGDTSFELDAVEFNLALHQGRLLPVVARAAAAIPALQHLAGSQDRPDLKFPDVYLKSPGGFSANGGNANPGEVFLELVQAGAATLDLSRKGDRAGGFLAPNLALTGLSRKLGPVGGPLPSLAAGTFDPTAVFGDLGDLLPKLFGCIKITDILDALGLDDLTKLPRFVTENLTAARALLDDLQRIQQHLTTLQGQLPGLAAQANAVATTSGTVVTRLQALLADPLSGPKRDALKTDFDAFVAAARALRDRLGGLSVPEEVAFARTQLEQVLGKVVAGLENAADVIAMVDRIADTLEDLNELRLSFEWKPPIKSWPSSKPVFEVKSGGGLVIAVALSARSGASKEPSFDVACRLQKFDLNLINPVANFLKLKFNKIEFTAGSRKKPDVNVDFGGIEFVGVLSFVEALRSLIPLDGFSDPPYLEVSEEGVEAGFSLGLPNIAIGVFSLQNLSLGASLAVPFIGNQPLSVRFNFCERSDPFRLTVWVFGGGGFFAVTVTPAGVQILEAAFEFGASVSLDFGVASGGVSVMAGVYYRMEADEASLTGYFNLKGRVSVLGLISASLELSLELTYEFASGKCKGRASLIIEVEVLFFSASVEVVCERKFKGSNSDPSFAQIMAPYADPDTGEAVDPWAEYCHAYAA